MLAWGEAWGAALSEPSPLPSVQMPRLLSDTFIGGHELCSHQLESLHNETQTCHSCNRQTHKGGNGSGQGMAAPSPGLGLAAGSKTRAPRAQGRAPSPCYPVPLLQRGCSREEGDRHGTQHGSKQRPMGTGAAAVLLPGAWSLCPGLWQAWPLAWQSSPGGCRGHVPQHCAARAGRCAPL